MSPQDQKFIDALLVGWGHWANDDGVNQRAAAAYRVLGIVIMLEARFGFDLSDDGFIFLDRHIAALPLMYRNVTHLEYRGHFETHEQKGRWLGFGRTVYGHHLAHAQTAILRSLGPSFDLMRQKSA